MKPERSEEKPSAADILRATRKLQVIAFAPKHPKDPDGQEYLISMLAQMVPTREQLDWLTTTAPGVMRKFSFAELRGIFCSKFDPADGIWAEAETPGFRPRDLAISAERRRIELEEEESERKWKQWQEDHRLEGAAQDPDPLKMLPSLREIAPKNKPAPDVRDRQRRLDENRKRARPRTNEEKEQLELELRENLQKMELQKYKRRRQLRTSAMPRSLKKGCLSLDA